MRFEKDSLIAGSWQDAPVRIHWSVVLGALFFSRLHFEPAFWIAFFGLVFIHEAGHALLVTRYRLWIVEIVVHGFGGYCRWEGDADEFQESVIAWGGVFAQFIVFGAAVAATYIFGKPESFIGFQIYHALIETNLWIIAINLIPVEPLDGKKAWRILAPLKETIQSYMTKMSYKRQDKKVRDQLRDIMDANTAPDASKNDDQPKKSKIIEFRPRK